MHTCFDSIHIKLFVTQKKYEIAACIINAGVTYVHGNLTKQCFLSEAYSSSL